MKKEQFMFWDIETAQTNIPDGDDLMEHLQELGISCCAAIDSNNILKTWSALLDKMVQQQCEDLVRYLQEKYEDGYIPVGWNSTSFDFRVLSTESGLHKECQELALNSIDPLLHFFCERGFAVGLNAVAQGMGTPTKSGHGADAPRMWAEGRRQAVLSYVIQDVRVLSAVFLAIRKHSCIRWVSRSGKLCEWIPSSGRILTTREALALPLPDVDWMKKDCVKCGRRVSGMTEVCRCGGEKFKGGPWPRSKFTGWLEQ